MSIVEKIGLLPILEQIGLNEEKFRGILKGEIETLSKQELVLNETIQSHANKINELTALRSKANQANEQEKLEIEAEKKKLFELRGAIEQERRISANEKQEVLILRQKLNDDKEQFRKDREIFQQRADAQAVEIKKQKALIEELEDKSKALDQAKDDLYVSQAKVREESSNLRSGIDELAVKSAEISSERGVLKNEWDRISEEKEKIHAERAGLSASLDKEKAKFEKIKAEFESEKQGILENLRQRELQIIDKESFIKDGESAIRRKLEDAKIELSKPKKVKKA